MRVIEETPMGEVRVPVRISNPHDPDRFWEGEFLVDTGATTSAVPTTILESIGIEPRSVREYWLADGPSMRRLVGRADFYLMGAEDYSAVMFAEADVEPILGLTVLESLGLLVDPLRERLLPRDALRV